ncbi:MAG TPA: putative toxin-antitoxin system toxin component, PIN family [Bacteroidales bacterium]|nr:putative toxin-antitoxin system toxin component, PIN family [Bacteroidales bacterium]
MKVVIDTNVFLVSLSKKSDYRWIFDSFLNEEITLCATTDILVEYEEIISKHMGREVATTVLNLLENASNLNLITRYFKWNLIHIDPDDNKFVDCAIASGAKYLVSNDKHFNVLKNIPFPKVEFITADKFKSLLGKA